ncbi:MAG: T9SS type B sorting domain-containing protein [Maribacter sp.]
MKMGIHSSLKTILLLTLILTFWQASSQTPPCTELSAPGNGDGDIALDVNFEWVASMGADSYVIIAGTTPGASDILDNINVGNNTEYDLPNNLPSGQTIYVRIIPENSVGQNTNCTEISFTTTPIEIPECVGLRVPVEGSVDVPINTAIEWSPALGATGYRLTIGSTQGGNDIIDDLDVGNNTTYQHPGGFTLLASIYIVITPYNDSGSNSSCSTLRFITTTGTVPSCTQIISPQDGTDLVQVNANITWIRDFTATGYLMTIREKEADGDFILREENVGNGTNYKPPNFEPRTKYFVTMIPYNNQGNAVACEAIEFTTGDPLPLPNCAVWNSPANGSSGVSPDVLFEWEEVPNTDGFILSVGTSLNGTDLINMEDVGNSTSYTLSEDLPIGATIYVKLNTLKGSKVSENCQIISFRVEGPDPSDLQNDIPKFFTPNNDGFNDLWTVMSTENISVDRILVFDRQGKLLKQLGDGQGWDGNFNGKKLPSASYWYSIELLNAPTVNGYFLLKR